MNEQLLVLWEAAYVNLMACLQKQSTICMAALTKLAEQWCNWLGIWRDYFKTVKGRITGLGRTFPAALNPLTCQVQCSCSPLQKWFELHFNTVEICFSIYLDSKTVWDLSSAPVWQASYLRPNLYPFALWSVLCMGFSPARISHLLLWHPYSRQPSSFPWLSFCLAEEGKLFQLS